MEQLDIIQKLMIGKIITLAIGLVLIIIIVLKDFYEEYKKQK